VFLILSLLILMEVIMQERRLLVMRLLGLWVGKNKVDLRMLGIRLKERVKGS